MSEVVTHIPKEMSDDLVKFAARADSILDDIMAELPSVPPASSVANFSRLLADSLGKKFEEVYPVVYVLLNLKLTQLDAKASVDELVDGIADRIEVGAPPFTPELAQKFHGIVPRLKQALKNIDPDSNLLISSKFASLAYNRQNVLHSSRIISDIRPVFDEAAKELKGMIVTHSLVITFSGGMTDAPQEIHLTMDWKDIVALREQCDRADAKADCIVKAMSGKPWRTIVYPEPRD